MTPNVTSIPIDSIRILNPRVRDPRKFEAVCESIKKLGLKKPIKISRRIVKDGEEPGYDLICGQGRIEAFRALGHLKIPAVVVEVSKADRLLMSLVENMARRCPKWTDLIDEIERLTRAGYNHTAIGKKLGIHNGLVGGILTLKRAGEERILDAAIKGKISIELAIEIVKADSHEAQLELLKAYESRQLTQAAIKSVRRVIDQRKYLGKSKRLPGGKRAMSADGYVDIYRKQGQRQKAMVRKAHLCDSSLRFLVTGFEKLFADGNFYNLLRAENLDSAPQCLSERLNPETRSAA